MLCSNKMNILIYLILFTVLVSVFIYNISVSVNPKTIIRDVESDNIDIADNGSDNIDITESTINYDIPNQIEHFYDSENITFPSPIEQGDVIGSDGRQCHWKKYKNPNYYGWGPWGKFYYGEPYYAKIRCEGDETCNDFSM